MKRPSELQGVIPAVVTPFDLAGCLELAQLRRHITTLIHEGCDGLFVMGTTGEGPSLGLAEREALIAAAAEAGGDLPLLAGTGTPSLSDTILLTQRSFLLGADAVVVVPPYYYKTITEEGLATYFRRLLEEAVPEHGMLLLYHIPQVTGIPISFPLLEELLKQEAHRLVGVKDSSGDPDHTARLCAAFPGLRIFVGSDRLFLSGLKAGAAGCITAGANILAPLDVAIYRAFRDRKDEAEFLQARLSAARLVLEQHPPFPASLKSVLALRYQSQDWHLRPPLAPLPQAESSDLMRSLGSLGLNDILPWLATEGRSA